MVQQRSAVSTAHAGTVQYSTCTCSVRGAWLAQSGGVDILSIVEAPRRRNLSAKGGRAQQADWAPPWKRRALDGSGKSTLDR
jgi:hypothetical protein